MEIGATSLLVEGGYTRMPCYCWKCNIQADFLQDFGSIQEYRCPKCYVRVRIGDPELFDPLRTPEDDSDSVSVCVSPTESRRSTMTFSEGEGGVSDDTDTSPVPVTPENLNLPSAPANTPAGDSDVPDAPPNIASAFADVATFLLNVPTPKRRSQRFSLGLSNVSAADSISPSKMIQNVMQAYKRFSLSVEENEKPEEIVNDRLGSSTGIEIRITQSPETSDMNALGRKVSATEISFENSGAGKKRD